MAMTFLWVPSSLPAAHQSPTQIRNTAMVTAVCGAPRVRKTGV